MKKMFHEKNSRTRQLQVFLKAFWIGDYEIKQNLASHVFFLLSSL
jgi:hypothetical protein